jgi:hypothetical protein
LTEPRACRRLLIAALAGSSAGCLVPYHPVAPRPPAAFVPVELNRYARDQWPAYLDVVAEREARVRRFVWANPSEPPCSGGAPLRRVDQRDLPSPDVDVIRGQRLRLGLREMVPEPPLARGPTTLDVEEVQPGGGTACVRIPVTGDRPEEQWTSTRKWVHLVDVRYGRPVVTAGDDRTVTFGWSLDGSMGVGRWLGPIRLDGAVALGAVGCTGCMEPGWLPKAGVQLGTGIIAWEGAHSALEINGGYRLSFAKDRSDTLAVHAARVGIAVGLKRRPAVGIIEVARVGLGGVELYAEWRAPSSGPAAPQLLAGIGLVTRLQPF